MRRLILAAAVFALPALAWAGDQYLEDAFRECVARGLSPETDAFAECAIDICHQMRDEDLTKKAAQAQEARQEKAGDAVERD